jgi:hypothetical protein
MVMASFFFFPIWLFLKRMWILASIVCFWAILLVLFSVDIGEVRVFGVWRIASIVLPPIFGAKGNAWRETSLLARGFKLRMRTHAANPKAAEAYYRENKETGVLV